MIADDEQRLKELLRQQYNGDLPPHRQAELFGLLQKAGVSEALETELQTMWEETDAVAVFDASQKEVMLSAITERRKVMRLSFRTMSIAAAVLLAFVTAGLLLWQQPAEKVVVAANAENKPKPVADVQAPAANKAVLTLADGSRIVLENTGEGKVASEGNVAVVKVGDGGLVYEGNTTEVKWNTLTVPKGSKPMRLLLADGSAITLNVASSLTYPTAFAGDKRQVTLTGEAYFEIAKVATGNGSDKSPFLVSVNGTAVEVTGTKFNVNAYEDEAATKTTLVEGAVKILSGTQQQAVLPGEQAVVDAGNLNKIKLNKEADIQEATAWLNGKFRFNNASVEAVMRQVARWYDVDVKYAGRPHLRFGGQLDRASTLRQMFAILETSGLHFTLSQNVVTVLP